jgi:hypothetical protein
MLAYWYRNQRRGEKTGKKELNINKAFIPHYGV